MKNKLKKCITISDYCNGEHFAPSCGEDSLMVIHEALYGRMTGNDCIPSTIGYFGCQSDVLAYFDGMCSGKSPGWRRRGGVCRSSSSKGRIRSWCGCGRRSMGCGSWWLSLKRRRSQCGQRCPKPLPGKISSNVLVADTKPHRHLHFRSLATTAARFLPPGT